MNSASRLAPIDALRGIAALLVVWQHTSESFVMLPGVAEHGRFLADLAWAVDFGRIGVICFFLISGFVIPYSLKSNNTGAVKKFAIRRFFRLFPAYWFSIAVVLGMGTIFGRSFSPVTVLANATMLQSFMGQPHLQGLYWTLQIELIFYVLCAIVFHFGFLHKYKALFLLSFVCFSLFALVEGVSRMVDSFSGVNKEFLYMPYILSIMFLGSLYRKVYDQREPDNSLYALTFLSTCICFGMPLFVLVLSLFGFNIVEQPVRFGASHCLSLLLFSSGLLLMKKAHNFMLWLGLISYSLYLFHPIIMNLIIEVVEKAGVSAFQGLHLSYYMGVAFILSAALATLVYVLLEKPAINLGHKLSKKDRYQAGSLDIAAEKSPKETMKPDFL